jgi:hypothetical protein
VRWASQARTARGDRVQHGVGFMASIFSLRVDGGAILSGCSISSPTRQRQSAYHQQKTNAQQGAGT